MKQRFDELLLRYAQEKGKEERKKIEDILWQEFGSTKAVFIMDMSGFCLLAHRHGIVHYLSMVRRMQRATKPIVEQYHGKVVKFEADNCFAMFDEPVLAVSAAIALNTTFFSLNLFTPDDSDIRVSIGIDYGDLLLIGEADYFGNTVNCASKLGEDIGGPGEILVTATAFKQISNTAGIKGHKLALAHAGVPKEVYSIKF